MIGGTLPMKEKARMIMTKIVNMISAKMEMRAPMISMYLLGNPDHYTDHKSVSFFCQSYVIQKEKIPNFIGAILPRKDHSDRNYYCLTMLALFKLWRKGSDLKCDVSVS